MLVGRKAERHKLEGMRGESETWKTLCCLFCNYSVLVLFVRRQKKINIYFQDSFMNEQNKNPESHAIAGLSHRGSMRAGITKPMEPSFAGSIRGLLISEHYILSRSTKPQHGGQWYPSLFGVMIGCSDSKHMQKMIDTGDEVLT